MKKENVQKVVDLEEERKELSFAFDLVQGGGDLVVYSCYGENKKYIRDIGLRGKIMNAIKERLNDIEQEIELL